MKNDENCLEKKKLFLSKLISIFESGAKEDRITVPLMKTIEMLLTSDYLS
jgi:hypothetical protein